MGTTDGRTGLARLAMLSQSAEIPAGLLCDDVTRDL